MDIYFILRVIIQYYLFSYLYFPALATWFLCPFDILLSVEVEFIYLFYVISLTFWQCTMSHIHLVNVCSVPESAISSKSTGSVHWSLVSETEVGMCSLFLLGPLSWRTRNTCVWTNLCMCTYLDIFLFNHLNRKLHASSSWCLQL